MKLYGLHGRLRAQQHKGNELVEIMLQASQLVSTLDGCLLYMISQDEDKDSVVVTEVWRSKEDHAHSLKVNEVRQLIGKAMPILAQEQDSSQHLQVIGGHGISS